MKTVFKAKNTDEIEFELTVSMPLKDWERFYKQLGASWPSWDFAQRITQIVEKARKEFDAEIVDKE